MYNMRVDLEKLIGLESTLGDAIKELDRISNYDVLNFVNLKTLLDDEIISVEDVENSKEYNIGFNIIKENDNILDTIILIIFVD